MKRLVSAAVLVLAAACTDTPSPRTASPASITEPSKPTLTAANLPSDASSMCRAAVTQRDAVADEFKSHPTAERQTQIVGITAVVEDACY